MADRHDINNHPAQTFPDRIDGAVDGVRAFGSAVARDVDKLIDIPLNNDAAMLTGGLTAVLTLMVLGTTLWPKKKGLLAKTGAIVAFGAVAMTTGFAASDIFLESKYGRLPWRESPSIEASGSNKPVSVPVDAPNVRDVPHLQPGGLRPR
jgi:hypothetical protein